jgi:hypothetical protein
MSKTIKQKKFRKFKKTRKTKNSNEISSNYFKKNKKGGENKDIDDIDELYDNNMIMNFDIQNMNKDKNVENILITQNDKVIVPLEKPNMLGGAPGTKINWIYDFTDTIINEFHKIQPDINLTTLSVFNPGLTWFQNFGNNISLYTCVSRCIYYKSDQEPNGLSLNTVNEYIRQMAIANKIRYNINNPDRNDGYVKFSGNLFNKWFGPYGFWGSARGVCEMVDNTVLTIFKREGNNIDAIYSRFLNNYNTRNSSPIDARITNIYNQINLGVNTYCNSFYITGSRSWDQSNWPRTGAVVLGNKNKRIIIDPEQPVDSFNNGRMKLESDPGFNAGWKQSLTRMQLITHIEPNQNNEGTVRFACAFDQHQNPPPASRNPFTNIERSNAGGIANCITWESRTEKNWVLHYYHTTERSRIFCPDKCVLLNYSLAGDIGNGDHGMIFYWKRFDSAVDVSNFNDVLNGKQIDRTWDVRDWNLIVSPNSSIFYRIEEHWQYEKNGKLTNVLHVSCTTPFIEINNSLFGVGHIKIDMFSFLNKKLEECAKFSRENNNIFGTSNQEFFTNAKLFLQGKTVGGLTGRRDHLSNALFDLIEWARINICNNQTHGINGDGKYIQEVHESLSNPYVNYSMLEDSNNLVRNFCIFNGFIEKNGNWWRTIRNLHPIVQYFMFFYKFNKNTLELESFSHPFIILKNPETSFLNFPVGLTTNSIPGEERDIWLSYGEGDCACHLAAFKESKFNEITSANNNNTDPSDIEFWLYKDRHIST